MLQDDEYIVKNSLQLIDYYQAIKDLKSAQYVQTKAFEMVKDKRLEDAISK
jgi:hypothetical protein